jgi:hypothetical protein
MGGVRAKSSFVAKFEAAVENLPMKEAVKYKSFDIRLPDLKWTAREYDVRLCLSSHRVDTNETWLV